MKAGKPQPATRSFSIKARLASFGYAFAGGRSMLAGQHNAWIHAAATVAVIALALAFGVSRIEWGLLLFAIGLVWSMEAMNTALEHLADELSLQFRPGIGKAKDVAAFAVLIAALTAVAIGCLVFFPYLFK